MSTQKTWKEVFSTASAKPAKSVYCIGFTPRSGSSWLGGILSKSGVLGDPLEYFNAATPELARYAIPQSGATDVREYFRYLKAVRQTKNVFGVEMAYQHVSKLVDEGYGDMLDDIDEWFLLRRRDYIAQAVSLYRASESGVFHAYQQKETIPETPYNGDKIAGFALAALTSEYLFDAFFTKRGISPLAIWYEDMLEMTPIQMVEIFTQPLEISSAGIADPKNLEDRDSFRKLSDEHSTYLAERFRQEKPEFLKYWDKNRGLKTVPDFMAAHPSYG